MNKKEENRSTDLYNFIDSHLRELRWISYGLGTVGTLIILRKIRASKKFKNVNEIPSHFISKHYTLQGNVRAVTDKGVLQIEHIPIIQFKLLSKLFKAQNQLLPVLPAGLDLNPDAIEWMKIHTSGKHAWFQMLTRDEQALYCDISVKKSYFKRLNISQELLKHSICKVHHFESPPDGRYFNNYLVKLISLEHKAATARRGKGIWKDEESSIRKKFRGVLSKVKRTFSSLFKRKTE